MRPRRLAMRAFGPFADPVEIDFTAFGASRLLLIHGPTGAGKSSILDAVAFALYGESSGGERAARDVRSHFAGPDEPTEVELELAVGDDRYRVRRQPEQELAKQRGEGTTVRKSEAELERWQEDESRWRPVASGSRDVDAAVERVIGIEAAHFRQVVVLPQGQFRRLLTADSAERERILATLFETARYERVQEELRRRAAELRRAIGEAAGRREALLAEHEVADEDALRALVTEHEDHVATLETELEAARRRESAAAEARDAARTAVARLDAVAEAERAAAELESRRPAMAARRTTLAAAERAAGLADLQREVGRRRADVEARRVTAAELANASAAADRAAPAARAELAAETARAPERDAAHREAEHLAGLEAGRAALEQAETELAAAAAARDAAEARRGRCEAALAEIDAGLEEIARRFASADEEAAQLQSAEYEQRRLDGAIAAAVRRDEAVAEGERLAGDLVAASQRSDRAAAALAAAEELLAARREAVTRGHAAAMARGLVAGEPCPVCGSTDHPAPATDDGAAPAAEEIERLEGEVADHRRRVARAVARIAELTAAREGGVARLEAAREVLGEEADVDRPRLEAARREAAERVARARDAAQRQTEAEAARQRLLAERETGSEALGQALAAARDAAHAAERATAVAEERRRALPSELRDRAALEQAMSAARDRLTALRAAFDEAQRRAADAGAEAARLRERLILVEGELRVAAAGCEQRAEELARRLQAAGFEDEAELQRASLDAAARRALEAEVEGWERAVAAAAEALARARERAEGVVRPDLAAVEAAFTAARTVTVELADERGTVRARLAQCRRTATAVAALGAEIAAADARHDVVGELAEVATDRTMPFSRYVLAAMLDEVLLEASQRLAAMSRGRFALRRDSAGRDRRRSGGLDLVVFDAHTGVERPVETLSGGESFLASLSLALGLAEVVQRHSGGVRLDTVFIDEGFGSLDPEALDLAWETLLDLHAEGRLVGVISHVPDLKERIPARIEVQPGIRGATVQVVV